LQETDPVIWKLSPLIERLANDGAGFLQRTARQPV
jgi:hypothetical protein